MPYTQDTRGIGIETPLGKDVLLLKEFKGTEALSRLFRFDLTLLSENRDIDFTKIVGQNVTVMMKVGDGVRYFNGVISRFTQAGSDQKFATYEAEMVPWLWFLTRTADCRIFQNATIPDIVQQLFSEFGFTDIRLSLQQEYEKKEFCVQYRETAFNFVSRLLEYAGIYYYFAHENGKHTLVLADSAGAIEAVPGQASARYHASQGAVKTDQDVVTGWSQAQSVRPAKYSLNDFNFETPGTSLGVSAEGSASSVGPVPFEVYDYPGAFANKAQGDALAKVRIEEEEAQGVSISGTSSCRAFVTGYKFDLAEHYRADANQTYLLTSLKHEMKEDSYTTGASAQTSYSNTFSCIPASTPFRPLRITPHPIIQGPQTAIVTGPPGEEIYVDKYGRVTVQFHWDRKGQNNESSSCPIRLAQNWAGKKWGAVFIPRVGQEVVVEFLEGDPDRPIVTGSVYNAEMTTPYALPGEQTKTAIRSNSTKGGNGANEIRFEDKKGSEQIYIHSQKDLDLVVKSTARERVGGARHLVVGADGINEIGGDHHLRVVGEEVVSIGKDAWRKVDGDFIEEITGIQSVKAGKEIALKAGMKIVIDAGMEITLKGAGGFIKIDPSGVTIQGTMVKINSGGAAGEATKLEAKEFKTPSGAASAPPGAQGKLRGFDWGKLADPNHKTTKYNFARVAMNYDLDGVTDKATAEDALASMKDDLEANGVEVLDIDGDKLKTRDMEGNEVWVDVVNGSGSGDPGFQWNPVEGPVAGGGLARHGLQSGVPAGQVSRMPGASSLPSVPAAPKGLAAAMPAGGGAPLEGFNPAKLANLSHQTPKYQFGRVAQNYDLTVVKDKQTAEVLLNQMKPQLEAQGMKVLGVSGDTIQTIDPATGKAVAVDVIKGANSGNPVFAWLPKL